MLNRNAIENLLGYAFLPSLVAPFVLADLVFSGDVSKITFIVGSIVALVILGLSVRFVRPAERKVSHEGAMRGKHVFLLQILGTFCVVIPFVLLSERFADYLPAGFLAWGATASMLLVIVSITLCTMSGRYRALILFPVPLIIVALCEVAVRVNPQADRLLAYVPHEVIAGFVAVFLLALADLFLNRESVKP